MSAPVAVRLDATRQIGSGHAMRCVAIAQALAESGHPTRFAVSCGESACFMESLGWQADVIGGDETALGADDGRTLARYCSEVGASVVFVDTYAADDEFFEGLAEARGSDLHVGYLDDLYTFGRGSERVPVCRPVDMAVNYSFYADEAAYGEAYAESPASLLLGPGYAPLCRDFWGAPARRADPGAVREVLITTGSTNPAGTLERLSLLALEAFPEAAVRVVVGAKASFDGPRNCLDVLGPQKSLLPLMAHCDVCVSAAGTTLYELCAVGVPTLALAIVENQTQNARAFERSGLGLGYAPGADDGEILEGLVVLRENEGARARFSTRMQKAVGGDGAKRIASGLRGLIG